MTQVLLYLQGTNSKGILGEYFGISRCGRHRWGILKCACKCMNVSVISTISLATLGIWVDETISEEPDERLDSQEIFEGVLRWDCLRMGIVPWVPTQPLVCILRSIISSSITFGLSKVHLRTLAKLLCLGWGFCVKWQLGRFRSANRRSDLHQREMTQT